MSSISIDHIKGGIRLVVGLFLISVICISAFGIVSERRDTLASAERLATGHARALSEHSESAFSEADAILRELLRDLRREGGLDGADQEELHRQMRRQLRDSPQVGTLFIVDRNGIMRLNSDEFPSRQIDVSDRDYYRRYLETPGLDFTIGKPLMSRLVQRRRFNLMRPLNNPGDPFDGLVALGFEAQYFNKFFTPRNLGLRGAVLLLREDGVPLVFEPHPRGEEISFSDAPLFRDKISRSPSGVYQEDNPFSLGQPCIVAYQRLGRFPVVAVVAFNKDDVLAPWSSRAVRQSLLTLGLCALVMVLTRLLFSHLDRLKTAQDTVMDQQAQLTIKAAQIDAALDVVLQVDEDGRLLQFNQALCRLTGYSPEELTGKRLQEIEPPEYVAGITANIERVKREGGATFESAYLAKDGTVIQVEVHSQVVQRDGRPLVLSIARDIRQRKRQELRERNRLKTLERLASDAALEELLTCIVAFVEKESPGTLCSMLLADDSCTRLRHGAGPSLPDYYNRAVDGLAIRNGKGSCGTAAYLRRRVLVEDIETHPYWKGFHPATEAGLRSCWSEPVISSNGDLLGTVAMYRREPGLPGEEEVLLLESAAHLASIAIGRVRSDESRRILEEQLRHSQKIEAVGQLAAGVAHDFNNLLTPIIVYADMIKRGLPDYDPRVKMIDGMTQAAVKASELTRKLLSLGRKQVLNKEALDLNEVISSFKDIMRTTLRESISIQLRLSPVQAQINADRGQLEQVLLNLLVNSQDAITGAGAITIETEHRFLDGKDLKRHPGAKPGRYVILAFTDDGCGMNEETLRRMYEPFFTTKEVGRGTGLGLATVYGIVDHHEGFIDVKSRPGRGTRFEICLPAGECEAVPVSGSPAAAQRLAQGEGRSVLLVEDNEVIREMCQALLQEFGFRVLAAESPSAALQLAAAEDEIDLLATDVIMPEMTGPELYQRLQRMHPALPALYISGYTNSFVPQQGDGFLAKPFTAEQFMEKVTGLLAVTGAAA